MGWHQFVCARELTCIGPLGRGCVGVWVCIVCDSCEWWHLGQLGTHTQGLAPLLAHRGNRSIFSCLWRCIHCMNAQSQDRDSAECLWPCPSTERPFCQTSLCLDTDKVSFWFPAVWDHSCLVCCTSWVRQTQGGGAQMLMTLQRSWVLAAY